MRIKFWLRRFALAFLVASAAIAIAQLLKGHDLQYSSTEGGVWGLIAAVILTGTRIYRSRRGEHCEICNDLPGPAASRDGKT